MIAPHDVSEKDATFGSEQVTKRHKSGEVLENMSASKPLYFMCYKTLFAVVISVILILSTIRVTNMRLQCLVYPYVNALLLRCTYYYFYNLKGEFYYG